ncbi:DEHA2D02442p [Debaryomyces hansenii CBS767]|jgi:diketogulonate reductase-like aldo/keto reductase|uniref:2-dehydropantolactone reductase n=1 Tax=Debaryomyces hansenii (strain ATCC 36239 / CBS 767 / BCRC 21394 / JCM 1990 / NBRC 0083 / IGC 2968) TaxID=284592 RepID=Q6BT96_DEBHA|nr:DEHA2D02442p [Debaryomyces hansenii CBS767]CAG86706.1 DEHA2D02442p [Debaryomyces hansenii CBS767]|eukprot:XP_458574.1 DEHA2D02442p [Debaryomyces hansenii CBS767]
MSNLTTSIQLTKQSRYRLNNGHQIPVTGFGCYEVPLNKSKELVYEALKAGYRHIDCAAGYRNEKETAQGVAEFLKENPDVDRQDIWYTTKIQNSDHGYEETKKAVQKISDNVKQYIGYVDLVLIHSPKSNKEKRLATWKALQEFVTNPTNPVLNIKSLGVSNYGIAHLEELLNWDGLLIKPVVDQLELHPWLPQLKLREYLVEHDILAEAYSPLTQGYKLNDKELLDLEAKYKIPKAEILLKWSFLQGFIVLVKSEKVERIKQNLGVLADGKNDELDETTHLGKVDLDYEILEALDKPESHEVLTWGNQDPTQYVDPK